MKQAKILIADDEAAITTGLSAILSDAGYDVDVVADGQKALDKLVAERYGVVLADLKMPRLDGLALLRELQQREIPTECIIITGQATVDSAVQAMQQGAYDYIEKPLNAEKLNRLKALIPKALDKYQVQQKNRELASKLEGLTHYGELTGQSEAMRSVYQVIEAVAPSTASVLILGESGTGKELVARALHSKSDRAKGPFFALNCAALPKEILENELFGHEKGAFTGSTNEKPGAFEMSSGGTIFLDEVAEMSPDIQVKLLRELQSKQIPTECIIITGQATVDSAVQAMQQGAYDYIEKPLNAEKLNRLKALIPKALDKYQVQQKNRELASKLEGLTHYGELTGQSEAMRSVYQVIEAVAPSTASVLILGESGTGKELVARALHSKSDRAKGPFFALNCAALPKEILENELFGHEKGAFTGSTNEKAGAFEMASGGTIFLDEMAEMPPTSR